MALRAFSNALRGRLQQQLLTPAAVCGGLQLPLQPVVGANVTQGSETQKRFASQLVVKQRMKSVGNIMKITKAMKMVAAARMKGAQKKVDSCRGIVDPSLRIFGDAPLVEGKSITIPVTSDKGLCGGVNSQVNRITRVMQDVVADEAEAPKLAIVGDKGRSVLSRALPEQIEYTSTEATKQSITFATVSAIAEDIMKSDFEASRIVFQPLQVRHCLPANHSHRPLARDHRSQA